MSGNVCYIERSKVREILITSDIDNESTRVVLEEVDALPIFTAADMPSVAQTLADRTDLEISDEWERRFGITLDPAECIPAQALVDCGDVQKVLGAFYKTVDVMKSARNTPNHTMCVWADDMRAIEDVMRFLENLRDRASQVSSTHREERYILSDSILKAEGLVRDPNSASGYRVASVLPSTHQRPGPEEGAGLTPASDRKDQSLVEEGSSTLPLAATLSPTNQGGGK